jgi:hypothetical protein
LEVITVITALAVITVVDAKHIVQHLDEIKPEGVENESVEQIAFADRVLLNKVDLATEEELAAVEQRIRSINAGVQILRTRLRPPDGCDPTIDLAAILNVDAFNLQKILQSEPDFLSEEGHEHEHDKSIGSVGFRLSAEMNVGKLNAWIQALMEEKGADLYRYKVPRLRPASSTPAPRASACRPAVLRPRDGGSDWSASARCSRQARAAWRGTRSGRWRSTGWPSPRLLMHTIRTASWGSRGWGRARGPAMLARDGGSDSDRRAGRPGRQGLPAQVRLPGPARRSSRAVRPTLVTRSPPDARHAQSARRSSRAVPRPARHAVCR